MDGSALQLALREWWAHVAQPRRLLILAGVAVILAIAGPFGTADAMTALPAFAYWLAIVLAGYGAGFVLNVAAEITAKRRAWPVWAGVALGAAQTGAAMSALILALNWLIFGDWIALANLHRLVLPVFAIALIISFIASLMTPASASQTSAEPPKTPPLLDRLPFDKRGALLAISVEDHYVQIRTDKGTNMVLMRLSDAIREVGALEGAQVHRSHWVAWGAIASAHREGDRAVLTLTSGAKIPVSRANLSKVKAQGLLPK